MERNETLVVSIYDGGFCKSALFVNSNTSVIIKDGYGNTYNSTNLLYHIDFDEDNEVEKLFNVYPNLKEIIICEDGRIRTYTC